MEGEELTPEGLEAWQRWVDEVERRSRACVEAAAGNWGGGGDQAEGVDPVRDPNY